MPVLQRKLLPLCDQDKGSTLKMGPAHVNSTVQNEATARESQPRRKVCSHRYEHLKSQSEYCTVFHITQPHLLLPSV